jgi:phosphatidylglycerophosphate synthase
VVALLIMLTGGQLHPAPTMLGKTSTVFQMIMVGFALLIVSGVPVPAPLRQGLIAATAVLTVASGVQYLLLAPRYIDWEAR